MLISLDYFQAKHRHYHIYRLSSSSVAEKPHRHDYYQVCCVVRGQIVHTHRNRSVHLVQGDVFIVPPGVTHSITMQGQRTVIDSLCFDEQLFSPGFSQSHAYQFLLKLQSQENEGLIRLRLQPEEDQGLTIRSLLDSLLREQQADWPRQLTASASLVAALLCVLAQCYYRQPQNHMAYQQLDENRRIMENCIAYIDAHYRERLNQTDLLRIFGLSRSSFCAWFPQYTGMSLKQYINQRRIRQAQILLQERPELSLQQVAEQVGYTESSTFYRNFIQSVGIPASRYREMYR